MKAGRCSKVLAMVLSFLMVFGVFATTLQFGAEKVYAGEGTDVTYSGESLGDQWVTDADGNKTQVFCVNEGRSYSSSYANNHGRSNVRVKYAWNEEPTRHNRDVWDGDANFTKQYGLQVALLGNMYHATGVRTDIGEHEFTFRDVEDGALAGLLTKVLYLGAPNNGEGTKYSANDTQDAVYWCIYSGKNNPDGTGGNDLVKDALALDYGKIADKVEGLYVYVLTPEMMKAGGDSNTNWEQCMVSASFTESSNPSKPNVTNTTAKVNDTATSVELASGEEGTMTDEITFENLEDGKEYTVISTLQKDGEEFATQTSTVKGPETSLMVTFDKKIAEAGEYKVKTELKDGDEVVATHNGNFDVDSETVTVTVETKDDTPKDDTPKDDTPKDDTPKGDTPKDDETTTEGKIATTVTAGGKSASASAAARLTYDEVSEEVTVEDAIDYEGLIKGATYNVSGTLVEVDESGNIVNEEVATASEDKVAEDASGTWTLSFGKVKLESYKKYVVFETATIVKDADGAEVTDGDTVEHKDANDTAQTVLTEDKDGKVLGEKETPKYNGVIRTTVSVGDKNATAEKAVELTAAEAEKATTVKDTIAYIGLQGGDTYNVTGTLMKVSGETATAVGSPVTKECVADASGEGTWVIEFTGVKLEADSKYVVFEEAVNADANKADDQAEHKDINDKAQTIVVAAKPAAATPVKVVQSPKTADASQTALWLSVFAIAVTGIVVLARRRKA